MHQSSDDVVGFYAGHIEQRKSKRPDNRMQRLDLGRQLGRCWWAMRFVLRIKVIAKRFAFGIKHDDRPIRSIVIAKPPKHVYDAVHGARRLSLRVVERRHRMIRAKQIRRAVNENKQFGVGHEITGGSGKIIQSCSSASTAATWLRGNVRIRNTQTLYIPKGQ